MNKRDAKIEALKLAGGICIGTDGGFADDNMSEYEVEKILAELYIIGFALIKRAEKLESRFTLLYIDD